MPEEAERGGPLWWLARLDARLRERQSTITSYEAYYAGQHRMAFATSKFREAFGSLFRTFSDNWCDLIVDASVERLRVEGFRFGQDQAGDTEAWRIWQANQLDADSSVAFTEAVKTGEAYLLVAPGDDGTPLITVEHPSQVIVSQQPGARRVRQAALKKWREDDDRLMATVYLPGSIHRYQSEQPVRSSDSAARVRWVPRGGDESVVTNPLGAVPMVPLCNNPSMLGGGQSDLAKVIPLQDAVNKLVCDMIVASEYAAFRQRWATGLEVPTDPVTGQPLRKLFDAAIDRVWTTGDPETKFGEFEASDLGNYVKAIEMLIQHVAAQTRTPPHYLLGQSGAFPSGESLKSTETGLVAKVVRKQLTFGEGLEETMRLAFRLKGDERRGNAIDAETLWRDPEARTEGELVDSLTKMATLGVPAEALWARWGATPQEIARWKAMQREAALEAALVNFDVPTMDGQGLPPEPITPFRREDSADLKNRVEAATALFRAGFDPEACLRLVGLDPIEHTGLLPVTLKTEKAIEAEGDRTVASSRVEQANGAG